MADPPPVPPQAVTAATAALEKFHDAGVGGDVPEHVLATVALEVAAPHIRAAEREACARLAAQVDARYAGTTAAGGIVQPVVFRPFADLLRKDHHAAT